MSRFVFNPFTGKFDLVGVGGDADSATIEAIVNREIDSGFDSVSGSIHQFVDGIIAAELLSGGVISDAIDSDVVDRISVELDSGGLIKVAIDSALTAHDAAHFDSARVDSMIDSVANETREAADGGYEFTGGFTDRTTGTAGVSDVGTDVEYTSAMVAAQSWLRFGFDSDAQDSNDSPYWSNGAGSEYEAPGAGTTGYKGVGLFSGFYMPHGVTSLFDFTSDSTTLSYNQAVTSGSLQYNAASGSLDMSQLNEGDFVQVRFDFNVTPQFANTTIEVGLIWQTRDSNDNPTFTFALTGEPIFYGSGTTGRTFLNRPIITAYLASNEDVNARALPAIRSDQPIFIQPLTTLFTVGR